MELPKEAEQRGEAEPEEDSTMLVRVRTIPSNSLSFSLTMRSSARVPTADLE
jgi:hypothetical protein